MQDKIDIIDDIIKESKLVQRWGSWCINMTDKDLPYGVNPEKKTDNTYSLNDKYKSVGYMYLRSLVSHPTIKDVYNATFVINLFISPKNIGNIHATYEVPMKIKKLIESKIKGCRLESVDNQKYSFQELASITVTFQTFANCDNLALKNCIC